ncbi:serine/threonine-protein phosphatase, partial [bacterium]|nr:serine/threonine-protein phosphatase [bacterium]
LSQDHTMVAEMVRSGLLEPEAAENHPDKHVITRAIGTYDIVQVDTSKFPLPIEIGDSFMLCSDGLYDLVQKSEIFQIIVQNPAQHACNLLI